MLYTSERAKILYITKMMNLVQLCFGLLSSITIIYGAVINLYEHYLPSFFSQTFRYGKFSAKNSSKLVIEVPKSWFKHFYVTAVLLHVYLLYLLISVYVFEKAIPEWIIEFLNLVCGTDRTAFTPVNKVCLASVLLSLQVFRRFHNTHYVSVFGSHSKINLAHYLVGLAHYPGAVVAIICEAPLFTRTPPSVSLKVFTLSGLTYWDLFAVCLFLWAWWHQHICTTILANLRKSKKGTVVSNDYKLPYGDWFEYLSAPHQTAEILMYTSLMTILWHNITWFFVFAWVLSNQTETILLSHWWYRETFDDYPINRKALVPLVY